MFCFFLLKYGLKSNHWCLDSFCCRWETSVITPAPRYIYILWKCPGAGHSSCFFWGGLDKVKVIWKSQCWVLLPKLLRKSAFNCFQRKDVCKGREKRVWLLGVHSYLFILQMMSMFIRSATGNESEILKMYWRGLWEPVDVTSKYQTALGLPK